MLLQIDKLGKVAVTVEENYWDNTKDYDKLTIVEKEGTFGTYISRKPVPAGTPLTSRNFWIPFSSLKEEIVLQFNELIADLNNTRTIIDTKESNLYKAIASVLAGGVALKQEFGDSEDFGISQKFLTKVIDNIQDQINAIYGSSIFGIKLTATPNIIQEGVPTQVTITGVLAGDTPDEIAITINGETTVVENSNTASVTITLAESTTVTGYAIQSGLTYEDSINVDAVNLIKYGSGSVYTDATNSKLKLNPKGTYNINVQTAESYIFFIVPSTMEITKATMNGFGFPLDEPTINTISGTEYKVYKSSNTYDIGSLTIEIE